MVGRNGVAGPALGRSLRPVLGSPESRNRQNFKLATALRRQQLQWRVVRPARQNELLVSYPKAGSTWFRIARLAGNGSNPTRSELENNFPGVEDLSRRTSSQHPLALKSHYVPAAAQQRLLAARATKVILLYRDPVDVLESFVNHLFRARVLLVADLENRSQLLSRLLTGTRLPYGSYRTHLEQVERMIRASKVKTELVKYEDLLAQSGSLHGADNLSSVDLNLVDRTVVRDVLSQPEPYPTPSAQAASGFVRDREAFVLTEGEKATVVAAFDDVMNRLDPLRYVLEESVR